MLDYDYYIVAFSGGKDSTACVLHLLDIGIPKEKIELWHHDIDGNSRCLMDWPITKSYCVRFAKALGLPIYFSWNEGGFEREMTRDNSPTAPIIFECPMKEGSWDEGERALYRGDGKFTRKTGGKGPNGTRQKFPQVSADLKVRWCSAYLKIDVGAAAMRNQQRFVGKKTLFITGERREESSARAKYKEMEPDRADLRNSKKTPRHVDHWRPVIDWKEEKVWLDIEKYRINPHPAYHAGFGRLSCLFCIFGNCNQFRSAQLIHPVNFKRIADYEAQFGVTIKRDQSLRELVKKGNVYPKLQRWIDEMPDRDPVLWRDVYENEIFTDNWKLPAGAFGDNTGPS